MPRGYVLIEFNNGDKIINNDGMFEYYDSADNLEIAFENDSKESLIKFKKLIEFILNEELYLK